MHGIEVVLVASGAAALAAAADTDLVLLDLGLPDLDGLEVLRRLRADSDVPVIVVSARESELDRVMGFEVGADDYVAKPFSLRELVGRIRAVARRSSGSGAVAAAETMTVLDELVIDRRSHRVTVCGATVELTPREFDLLSVLARDAGATITRERLMDEVWDTNWFGSTKTLDVHVGQLRRKLGRPEWIETVRGVGFRLVAGGAGRPPAAG